MTCVITSENTVVLGGCEQLIAGTTVQCTWDGGENQCTTCPAGGGKKTVTFSLSGLGMKTEISVGEDALKLGLGLAALTLAVVVGKRGAK